MYFNQGINWVQGEAAAKSWYVPAGQTALLMDSEEQIYMRSIAEMQHADDLHADVVELIQEHRQKVGEPPKAMMELYDYLHDRHIEDATEVKVLQASYK